MNRRRLIIRMILAGIAILVTGWVVYYRRIYPYGGGHCCILCMSSALQQYAEDNGGKFPAGQSSPEASLSLLYKSNYADAYLLRGMTVSNKKVQTILEAGGLLGPDSCGWHYVPGLTEGDNPAIAILWCKEALGHNGQRTKDGGRQVVFLDGAAQWISGQKWPGFLTEQARLLQRRGAVGTNGLPLIMCVVELPDGTRTDKLEGHYEVSDETAGADGFGGRSSSRVDLKSSQLVWYNAPMNNGSLRRTVISSMLYSDPVTINFTNGVPDVTNVIFKMRSGR